MTDQERKEIRMAMGAQIEEIRSMLASHKESSKPVEPDNAIGRLTRMEAIGAKQISQASLDNSRARLGRLENALKRLDTTDYGICSMCEEDIPIKRLMLMPEATRCVACMEGMEAMEG